MVQIISRRSRCCQKAKVPIIPPPLNNETGTAQSPNATPHPIPAPHKSADAHHPSAVTNIPPVPHAKAQACQSLQTASVCNPQLKNSIFSKAADRRPTRTRTVPRPCPRTKRSGQFSILRQKLPAGHLRDRLQQRPRIRRRTQQISRLFPAPKLIERHDDDRSLGSTFHHQRRATFHDIIQMPRQSAFSSL